MGTSARRRWRRWGYLPVVVVALVVVVGASAQTGMLNGSRSANDTRLGTWRSIYDWPDGDGYAGWQSSSSSPADYGLATGLGGKPGLWLWAKGGQHVYTQNDYAEWTYTAPGTTRLARTALSFTYQTSLLSHHCIDVGFRTALGTVITHQEICRGGPHAPSSQDVTNLQLVDPAPNPTSTVLYLRIHVNCGGAATCHKTVPQLDPLRTAATVRFLRVDSTLVDDDNPVTQPSGTLFDLSDHFVDGTQTYGVTVGATDAGAGIFGSSLVHTSRYPPTLGLIGARLAPCDPDHKTPALDTRNCPASFSWDASVATPPYPEGPNYFTESVLDAAGHLGLQTWTVYVDRTPPDSVVASGSMFDLGGQTTDGSDQEDLTITAHDPGVDTQKASGIARVWYEEVGVGTIDSSDNPDCTELICPDTYTADFSVDLSNLSDGVHTFVVKASDLVGHVTEGQTWTITILGGGPQVAPDEPVDAPADGVASPDAPGGGADSWDASTDPDPACDAYVDLGVPDWCTAPAAAAAASPVGPAAAVTNPATSYTGCGLKAVFWSLSYPDTLTQQLTAHNVGVSCGDYYIAVEPGQDKQQPLCLAGLRDSWPSNIHAAPVFQWSAWIDYAAAHTGHWYAAGVEFRRRMALPSSGCQPGDSWFVNELPTSWHNSDPSKPTLNATVRAIIVKALRGLYTGPDGSPTIQGFTADVVFPQNQTNTLDNGDGHYKKDLEQAYKDSLFWRAVGMYVQGFGKEAYNQCSKICVQGQTAAQIADKGVNNYSYHESWLAAAAPVTNAYNAVKTTMRARHFALLNAVWNSGNDVFGSRISVKQMARVIRQQIYSARRIAATQVGGAGRIGFAWKESNFGTPDPDPDGTKAKTLAANLAAALASAYGPQGTAAKACQGAGEVGGIVFYGCPPVGQTDGAFNSLWDIFKTWTP